MMPNRKHSFKPTRPEKQPQLFTYEPADKWSVMYIWILKRILWGHWTLVNWFEYKSFIHYNTIINGVTQGCGVCYYREQRAKCL